MTYRLTETSRLLIDNWQKFNPTNLPPDFNKILPNMSWKFDEDLSLFKRTDLTPQQEKRMRRITNRARKPIQKMIQNALKQIQLCQNRTK